MKFIFILTFVWSGLVMGIDVPIRADGGSITHGTSNLLGRRGELYTPEMNYDIEELNLILFSDLKNQNNDLKKVKFYLLNGEIRLARVFLEKLAYTQTKLRPIIFRYLAILSFVESDFEKTYEYLKLPELQRSQLFSKICVLKTLSEIVLSKMYELEDTWVRCKGANYLDARESNLVWLDTLVQLKLNPRSGATSIPFRRIKFVAFEIDELKTMMKLALYLNQEELLVEQIPEFGMDLLQDPEIREMAGQAFFRTGQLANAYRFIEDLKSPNSENIKGNLYVLRNKYELAYAQFKLALEQKQNSQNAMERLLPIAWLLGDWEGGAKYSNQIIADPKVQVNKLTLMAAFNMQKGDYKKATDILNKIGERSRRGTEVEVTQLAAFTALMQNKPNLAKKQAFLSCEQYDVVNCWLLFQLGQWDSFPLTIRREEKISDKREWEKLIKEDINDPIQETVFVNQIDVEEMDDKLIQLIQKK